MLRISQDEIPTVGDPERAAIRWIAARSPEMVIVLNTNPTEPYYPSNFFWLQGQPVPESASPSYSMVSIRHQSPKPPTSAAPSEWIDRDGRLCIDAGRCTENAGTAILKYFVTARDLGVAGDLGVADAGNTIPFGSGGTPIPIIKIGKNLETFLSMQIARWVLAHGIGSGSASISALTLVEECILPLLDSLNRRHAPTLNVVVDELDAKSLEQIAFESKYLIFFDDFENCRYGNAINNNDSQGIVGFREYSQWVKVESDYADDFTREIVSMRYRPRVPSSLHKTNFSPAEHLCRILLSDTGCSVNQVETLVPHLLPVFMKLKDYVENGLLYIDGAFLGRMIASTMNGYPPSCIESDWVNFDNFDSFHLTHGHGRISTPDLREQFATKGLSTEHLRKSGSYLTHRPEGSMGPILPSGRTVDELRFSIKGPGGFRQLEFCRSL